MKTEKKRSMAGLVSYGIFLAILLFTADAFGWWNEEWQYRRKITLDTSTAGADVKENISEIFEPFFSTKGEQGNGLGLPAVLRVVELHGGKIWAESEGEGKGATFRFIIQV